MIDYFAFRGYEVAFYIGNAPTQDAYVMVGGTRVDSDGTASEYMQLGLYTYTIPLDAEDMILDVSKADYKVTYMYGNEKLLDAYVKANDLAYEKDFAIQGKVITGWYTDSSLETPFNFETPITQDTVLYAATEDVLVVNFRDAADDALLSFTNVTSGNTVAQPADPQKENMTFVGWYADKNDARRQRRRARRSRYADLRGDHKISRIHQHSTRLVCRRDDGAEARLRR